MEKATAAVWRSVLRLDRSKINPRWLAFRNAIGVALPLVIGMWIGEPLGAVAVTTGALNVAYSDGRDPYRQRAHRMFLWSFLGAFAVFLGSITGKYHAAAIVVTAGWAFAAGLAVAVSTRAGDLGLNTLVALIVFGARGALSPVGAAKAAGLVLGGGLLQTALALVFWPVKRYEPERLAVGKVFLDLAEEIRPGADVLDRSPLQNPPAQVQDVLAALGRDHTVEGERFRLLFDQADRLRLSVYLVARLGAELDRHYRAGEGGLSSEGLDDVLAVASEILKSVATCLLRGTQTCDQDRLLKQLAEAADKAQAKKRTIGTPLSAEAASAVDALAGQIRLVVRLSRLTTPPEAGEPARQESEALFRTQVRNWVDTLGANLDLRSAACRHALRLAVCVAVAEAIGRSISWQRSYWLPMTVAVILKPDFTTTFSRGVLRLAGTYAGLVFATVLYHILPPAAATQFVLVGVFTFAMRWLGPANYGVFTICVSGLIVFLIAVTGVQPSEVVLERFLNTSAGGLLALLVYALWPTWERKQVGDTIAEMLDACRAYLHAVFERFGRKDDEIEARLEFERGRWMRARSNAEASVDRVNSEPGTPSDKVDCLTSILASSHSLVHSITALEAGIAQTEPHTSPEAMEGFAHDAEFTLYFLAAALRGSQPAISVLPKLRDDHRRMLETRDAFAPEDEFVLIETDRITVALNTLRERVLKYVGADQPRDVAPQVQAPL
jgi:uncharacterized membrane protein YccC